MIVLRLLFHICLAKVAIGIRLVFRVAGRAMVICRSSLVELLNRIGHCDWLFVLGHAMVIRLLFLYLAIVIRLLAGLRCLLASRAAILIRQSFLIHRTVICLLLLDVDSLGWLDCLLFDNCFLLRLRCVCDSCLADSFRQTICFFHLLVDGVFCEISLAFLYVAPRRPCFAGDSNSLVVDLAECICHFAVMVVDCPFTILVRVAILVRLSFIPFRRRNQ